MTESDWTKIPSVIRDAPQWSAGSAVDQALRAVQANGEAIATFSLSRGWAALVLQGAVARSNGELKWWAQETLQFVNSYAEIRDDAVVILFTVSGQGQSHRYTSARYGYDIAVLREGERIPLVGRVIQDVVPGDRTAELKELCDRMSRVDEEEARTVAAREENAHAISSEDADRESITLPGFGSIVEQGENRGRSARQLRANEVNRYQALWEFALGEPAVQSVPVRIQLGRSNICNFKCVYCSDHRVGNDIPRTKLDGETWLRLTRLIPKSGVAAFHGVSEFLMDPEFFEIVKLCADSRVGLALNTNGSVCTPKHLEAIAGYPEHLELIISVDAATPETYRRLRGWDFFRLLANIRKFVDALAPRKFPTSIGLSFVITRSNVLEMVPFIYMGKALGVNSLQFLRLNEYELQNWVITAKDGQPFDYRSECATQFVDIYNREIENARRVADFLRIDAFIPPPLEKSTSPPLPVIQGVGA